MMQRDVQLTIAAVFTGWLLAAGAAWAQPAEPARPAEPTVATDPGAAPAAAAPPAAAATASDKTAKPAATATALPPGTSIKVERTANGAKLFRITEGLVVEGQMQRPNAFLVLQRATVDYDYDTLSESFLPRILASTREKPF